MRRALRTLAILGVLCGSSVIVSGGPARAQPCADDGYVRGDCSDEVRDETSCCRRPLWQPTRVDVTHAVTAVGPAVAACAAGHHGAVRALIVFDGPSGSVRTVTLAGPDVGTPISACMERAIRAARVPPFTRDSFEVSYPFRY